MIKGNSNQINEFHRKNNCKPQDTDLLVSGDWSQFELLKPSLQKEETVFIPHSLVSAGVRTCDSKIWFLYIAIASLYLSFPWQRGQRDAMSGQRREPLSHAAPPAREPEQHPVHAGACWVISRSTRGTSWEALLSFPAPSMDQQGAIPHQKQPLGLILAPAQPCWEDTELPLQLLTGFCSESAVAREFRAVPLLITQRENSSPEEWSFKETAVPPCKVWPASHIGIAQPESCIKNKIAKPTCFQDSAGKFCLFGDR